MLWAIVNNEKVQSKPNSYGKCPLCGGQVLSKCGEIKVWHWAHFKDENCDSWYEPESHWHLHWKMTFGKDHAEIVIKNNDNWHIADILT
ncbi:MAG TPA: competence protein CoiA family protein, partial [Arenibacter sp.]|nr:competence protein CoiA family protein [Arenibacter sp.]